VTKSFLHFLILSLQNANAIFPFPLARLYDSSCKYSFPTLVNSAGEVVESISPPTFKKIACNKEDFNQNIESKLINVKKFPINGFLQCYSVFRQYVTALGQTETRTFADAGVALLKVRYYK